MTLRLILVMGLEIVLIGEFDVTAITTKRDKMKFTQVLPTQISFCMCYELQTYFTVAILSHPGPMHI
jgi:hypothetical protein